MSDDAALSPPVEAAPGSQSPTRARAAPYALHWLAFGFVVAVILTLLLPRWQFFTSIEEYTRDLRVALASPTMAQNQDIVIIGVTEETLDTLRYRVPLDRGFLARTIRALDDAGVRAIGVDFALDTETDEGKDENLRRAIREARTEIIPITWDEALGTTAKRAAILRSFIGDRPTGYGYLRRNTFDGTVRHHYPVWNETSPIRYQFAAAIAHALGHEVPQVRQQRIDWHGVPTMAEGETYVEAFKMYDAHTVRSLPAAWLEGKIALIGPVMSDIDFHRTPLAVVPSESKYAQRMPGVIVHAHILAQIMDGRTQDEFSFFMEVLLALVVCGLAIWIAVLGIPMWGKILMSVAVLLTLTLGSGLMFNMGGLMMPVMAPTFGFAAAAFITIVYAGREDRNQRAMIRSAFAKYVPPAIVSRLERDPSRLELGGHRETITLMFTDLEGFTSIAESMEPNDLQDFFSPYLDNVGRIILAHGGTLDKFLGDGSMSFFGAPEPSEDHAERAVACALEIHAYSERFRAEKRREGRMLGRTRIGVHTGDPVVGNFGGHDRFDYTAIGDAVNTCARLEAANKTVRTNILVSEDTRARTPGLLFRSVGDLILPGKTQPIPTYEPLDPGSPAAVLLETYEKGFAALAQGDAQRAHEHFEILAKRLPQDGLIQFHLERARAGETGRTISVVTK